MPYGPVSAQNTIRECYCTTSLALLQSVAALSGHTTVSPQFHNFIGKLGTGIEEYRVSKCLYEGLPNTVLRRNERLSQDAP